jgi:hypothetical protein
MPESVVEPVPPYTPESVVDALTTPLMAWSGPVSVPMVTVPVLEILKSVEVAVAVEEPMAKRVWFTSPLFAWMESLAYGEVEPTPATPAPGLMRVLLPNGFSVRSAVAPVVKTKPWTNPLFAPVLFPVPISTPTDDCAGETPICSTPVFTPEEVLPPRMERNEFGEVVPMPTLPDAARKSEEVAVMVLVLLKYGN